MALIAKDSGGDFEITPEGTHLGICYSVIDLGLQFNEKFSNTSHKVMLSFEFPDEKMADDRPFVISKAYTLSLSKKSNLRRDLESWRGKIFTEKELLGFDLGNILGKACLINVIHSQVENKTYANIAAMMPLPKGTVIPKLINARIYYEIEKHNESVFVGIPEWIQKIIKKAKTEKEVMESEVTESSESGGDDIPF